MEFFRPGDVYVTCHSNLSKVQAVFHLVTDPHWDKAEVTSRHPYVNGLRNCVRLAARNGVGTLWVPLFLNKQIPAVSAGCSLHVLPQGMPVSFYQAKADLIFKCTKGFLMEVCSSGAYNAFCAPFSSRSVHYNINFGIPATLGKTVFDGIVDVFLQIFHLVPTVNG